MCVEGVFLEIDGCLDGQTKISVGLLLFTSTSTISLFLKVNFHVLSPWFYHLVERF